MNTALSGELVEHKPTQTTAFVGDERERNGLGPIVEAGSNDGLLGLCWACLTCRASIP